MRMGEGWPARYVRRKRAKLGREDREKGRSVPARGSVRFGCVRPKGRVCTAARGTAGREALAAGREMRKGREGGVKVSPEGMGLGAVASAEMVSVPLEEVRLKEVSVTSLARSGRGASCPGAGMPGIAGTALYDQHHV